MKKNTKIESPITKILEEDAKVPLWLKIWVKIKIWCYYNLSKEGREIRCHMKNLANDIVGSFLREA
jgi:hypothetical protein